MTKISLAAVSSLPPKSYDKGDTENATENLIDELRELQNVLFAQQKYSLLVVLQGMDASGTDGVIKEVFSGVNPMGCRVQGFKKPTEEEMGHDFLWRIHRNMPTKGMIQIFNRSHYEDVVIQKVHNWVDENTIQQRYEHINAFEKLVQSNNTVILKFYLHVSREEQQERLKERLSDLKKCGSITQTTSRKASVGTNIWMLMRLLLMPVAQKFHGISFPPTKTGTKNILLRKKSWKPCRHWI
jgi:polyphosphate kinase 2 (PPK2 family)